MDTSSLDSDDLRESRFYRDRVDPWARQVIAADDPWLAYRAAMRAASAVDDDLSWLPHGGSVYVQWMELSDLFDDPRYDVRPEDAQQVLRRAANRWLTGREARDGRHWNEWCATDFWAETFPGRPNTRR